MYKGFLKLIWFKIYPIIAFGMLSFACSSKFVNSKESLTKVVDKSIKIEFTGVQSDTVILFDTVKVKFQLLLPPKEKIESVIWLKNSLDTLCKREEFKSPFEDSCEFTFDTTGLQTIDILITDSLQKTYLFYRKFIIIQDTPKVVLGNDTTLGLKDTLQLKASVYKRSQQELTFAWSIGPNAPFTESKSIDTFIVTPSKPVSKYPVLLKATTKDKFSKTDTLFIKVQSSPPKLKISTDTVVGLFQKIPISIQANDNGSIIKKEWSFNNTSSFITTNRQDTLLPAIQKIGSLKVFVKVTDDDLESTIDSVSINSKLLWEKLTYPKEFTIDKGHILLTHQNKLWLVSGSKDVWASGNGADWEMITDSAAFNERYGHATLSFKEHMWITGGRNTENFTGNTWKTRDGSFWQRVTAHKCLMRVYHASFTFKNKLWIIGGMGNNETEPCLNDIWNSEDGENWINVSESAKFSPRYGHQCIVFNGKIWLFGGYYEGMKGSATLRDIWYSQDGINWEQVNQFTSFSRDYYHSFLIYNEKLWAIGGQCRSLNCQEGFNDIWNTEDGIIWKAIQTFSGPSERYSHSSTVFNNTIFIHSGDSPYLWKMR